MPLTVLDERYSNNIDSILQLYEDSHPNHRRQRIQNSERGSMTTIDEVNEAEQERALEKLQAQWMCQDVHISEATRRVRRLEADIIRLRKEAAFEAAEPTTTTTPARWWKHWSSLLVPRIVPHKAPDTAAAVKKARRLNRMHSIRNKREELSENSHRLFALQRDIEVTTLAIEELEGKIQAGQRQAGAGRGEHRDQEGLKHLRETVSSDVYVGGMVYRVRSRKAYF
ncbi:hypothetical protein F4802DRAFT_587047 [Xylaria palmicola]|nr:hypothetical protein F4802DRAFT_587047 [Xylaria palmicola]